MKRLSLALLVAVLLLAAGAYAQDQTIVEIATSNDDFSTLVTALQAADLVDVLADPDAEWTVFAPTNAAFEALPAGVLETLLADKELLTRVLTYHVIEGTVTSDMLSDMMAPSMEMTAPGADLMGSELEVTVADDGTVMVNDATVITADILASNGVIHVIDRVLVPADIAMMLDGGMMSDDTMGEGMMMGGTLFATLNPADLANDAVVSYSSDLMGDESTFSAFEGVTSVQSLEFSEDGTAYVTADLENGGGILVIEGLGMADSMDVGMGTRLIGGNGQAGLNMPKGLEVIDELDLVLVANFGASNIKGFSLSADGDVSPTVFIEDLGGVGGSIWDVHYDATTDTLFAAGTTGTLLVYGTFSETLGVGGPTAQIIPGDESGNQISVNLHGVDYDAASDSVILTDVGAADSNTDGQIFVISGLMGQSGIVPVTLQIGGPESMLGNPVDVVWDGSGAYVAEKANDLLLYYPDLLGGMGMMDMMAPTSLAATKPESVTLFAGGM